MLFTYVIGAGWKDMISSYRSSFSCSRLMSSLCTVGKRKEVRVDVVGQISYSRSNSKNSGSRGGATGSSSGSC
jgi:hypothetical protein